MAIRAAGQLTNQDRAEDTSVGLEGSNQNSEDTLIGGGHSSSDKDGLTNGLKSSFREMATNSMTSKQPTSCTVKNNRALARKGTGPGEHKR